MFGKRFAVAMMLVLALTMVITSCQPAEQLAKELNLNLGTEPPTLDPSLATDTTSVEVDESLFLGLTDFDDNRGERRSRDRHQVERFE
jgi:oligopeptide transport system substrate-binding protein